MPKNFGRPVRRFLIKLRPVFVLPLAFAFVVLPSAAHPCDCKDLEAIQTHLRNAMYLQKSFDGKISDLQKKVRPGIANEEFEDFIKNLKVTPPAGETGPTSVTYTPRGDDLIPDRYGEVKGKDLCLRNAKNEAELKALERGLTCAELGTISREHEDSHVTECARLGYTLYRKRRHVAKLAAEEAAAYGRQAAALRALIGRVLERSTVLMEAQGHVTLQMPPNSPYTASTVDDLANIPVKLIPSSGAMIKLEGRKKHSKKFHVDGSCRITTPMPMTVPAHVGIETDGLDAQIRYSIEGTWPAMGMECVLDGKKRSVMSMPLSNLPFTINLPLRNGAEYVIDMAQSPGAQMLRQGGMQMGGENKTRLVIECQRR